MQSKDRSPAVPTVNETMNVFLSTVQTLANIHDFYTLHSQEQKQALAWSKCRSKLRLQRCVDVSNTCCRLPSQCSDGSKSEALTCCSCGYGSCRPNCKRRGRASFRNFSVTKVTRSGDLVFESHIDMASLTQMHLCLINSSRQRRQPRMTATRLRNSSN